MMRDWLLFQAKRIFRRLPLSDEQKMQLAFRIFSLTGNSLAFLPSYQQWKREQMWNLQVVPKDLPIHRQSVLDSCYQGEQPPTFLMINHALGGGTGQHVEELAASLAQQGIRTLVLQWHGKGHFRLVPVKERECAPLFFHWPEDLGALADLKTALNLRHIHLHHTMDFPTDFLAQFRAFVTRINLTYDYTIHDYFSICPRFTLFDETVRGYCGEPTDTRKCDACIHSTGSAIGHDVNVAQWRHDYAAMMKNARRVFAPNEDVIQRMRHYAAEAPFHLVPHAERHHAITPVAARHHKGDTLNIVTVGGIAPHKGSKVLLDCAQDALTRKLPIHFTLIGYSDIDHKLKGLSNVTVTGRFKPDKLPGMLQQGKFHAAFLPSVIPETYNYALSECWRAGLFSVSFDIGAIASRIKAAEFGHIIPLEHYFKPDKINNSLLAMPIRTLTDPAHIESQLHSYPSALHDYYELVI